MVPTTGMRRTAEFRRGTREAPLDRPTQRLTMDTDPAKILQKNGTRAYLRLPKRAHALRRHSRWQNLPLLHALQ